jgi:flagellar biosynthesis/type III secretory pathway protein FliH
MDGELERLAQAAIEAEEQMTVNSWAFQRGLQRGLAQGLERGLEQGRVLGHERGQQRGLAQGLVSGVQTGFTQGRVAGLREALWTIVEQRELTVDDQPRATVDACDDADTLRRWLTRVVTAKQLADALRE